MFLIKKISMLNVNDSVIYMSSKPCSYQNTMEYVSRLVAELSPDEKLNKDYIIEIIDVKN